MKWIIACAALAALYGITYTYMYISSGGLHVENYGTKYSVAKKFGFLRATGDPLNAKSGECTLLSDMPWVESSHITTGIRWYLKYQVVAGNGYAYHIPAVRVSCPNEKVGQTLLRVKDSNGKELASGTTLENEVIVSTNNKYDEIKVSPYVSQDPNLPDVVIRFRSIGSARSKN